MFFIFFNFYNPAPITYLKGSSGEAPNAGSLFFHLAYYAFSVFKISYSETHKIDLQRCKTLMALAIHLLPIFVDCWPLFRIILFSVVTEISWRNWKLHFFKFPHILNIFKGIWLKIRTGLFTGCAKNLKMTSKQVIFFVVIVTFLTASNHYLFSK